MSKTKISEYSTTPANNTDIDGVNIAEGCPPSGINNAIRTLMTHVKEWQDGSSGDATTFARLNVVNTMSASVVTGTTVTATNATVTNLTATNLTATNLNGSAVGTMATQNANNVAITGGSIAGITDLAVADGGTGRSTLTANNVLLGNGTSAVNFVAPGSSGNVLSSNGTTWVSAAGVTESSFTGANQDLSASGYQKLPGGLILQWGTFTPSSGSYELTFPTAFQTACVHVSGTRLNPGDTGGVNDVPGLRSAPTTTGASLSVSGGNTVYWFALGY